MHIQLADDGAEHHVRVVPGAEGLPLVRQAAIPL
jgi:hypothetical protein